MRRSCAVAIAAFAALAIAPQVNGWRAMNRWAAFLQTMAFRVGVLSQGGLSQPCRVKVLRRRVSFAATGLGQRSSDEFAVSLLEAISEERDAGTTGRLFHLFPVAVGTLSLYCLFLTCVLKSH